MQLGFFYDQTSCYGCSTCDIVCRVEHHVEFPAHWRRVKAIEMRPASPILSMSCLHCVDPACVAVCPADAISKREEDGIVVVDMEKCRGRDRCGKAVMIGISPEGRISPCTMACPAQVNSQGYIGLIAKGKFQEALDLIREKMPLPAVCGSVCHRPCETVCKRQNVDEPVAIGDLKQFVSNYSTGETLTPLPITRDQKVAIVGSGPAGLAAAYDLIRKGYSVTVFEALPVAGGMLAVGIPEYRLPKAVLQKEIEYLEALGIEIKTNTSFGAGLTLDDFAQQGYAATFIAIGANKSLTLEMPGVDLEGVDLGGSFLQKINAGQRLKVGKRVVVIGGGNVAIDAARSAWRLGAKEVHLACLECREEMPAFKRDIESAEEEGIIVHCSRAPQEIVGRDGKVAGVSFVGVTCVEFDPEGRIRPILDDCIKDLIAAETVIIAIGQSPDPSFLAGAKGLDVNRKGTIVADPDTLATNLPGVFAGGDAVTGTASFVEAIAAGQKAAASIQRYLEGRDLKADTIVQKVNPADIEVEISKDIEKRERQRMPSLPMAARSRNFREVSLGFSEEMAVAEAERCMSCAGMLCRQVCPYDVPQFGPEENAKMQKCDFCLERIIEGKRPLCAACCPASAIDAGQLDELAAKYGEIKDASGFRYSTRTKPSIVFKRVKEGADFVYSPKSKK